MAMICILAYRYTLKHVELRPLGACDSKELQFTVGVIKSLNIKLDFLDDRDNPFWNYSIVAHLSRRLCLT